MVLNPVISKLAGKLVVLASASPRRLEILRNAGLRFEVVPSWFKETLDKRLFKAPHEYAVETAKQKALEVARRMPLKHLKTPDVVIGADTIVTVDGIILEKPVDKHDAYRMLSSLSGKEHSVFTGVAIVDYQLIDFYEETKVKFADLSEDMLWEYINSGEPMCVRKNVNSETHRVRAIDRSLRDVFINVFCKQEQITVLWCISGLLDMLYSPVSCASFVVTRSLFLSQALFTASKLRVFDLLHTNAELDVEQVAQEIKASVRGTRCLLEACVSLGLLKTKEKSSRPVYRNTDLATRFLCSDAHFSLHGYIQYCNDVVWPLFSLLESAVLEGSSQREKLQESQSAAYNSQEVRLRFMSAMHCTARIGATAVAVAFDLSSYKTACDLGGCTGAVANELVKAHPELSVSVFDLPAVVELSEHFHPQHADNRVSFQAGDFFKDELPKADLYILVRVLHDLTDEKLHVLLSKVADACTPGCGLLLGEIFLEENRSGPSLGLLQALSMSEGKQRSATEYSQLLKNYGFITAHVKHTNGLLGAMLCIKA
uniref:Acetylserotonin O-methyltransferase-like n=1 Tax=Nothobranchius furzeri TaxID=105023 RepID=A0A8C6MEZ2_NOTFU